MGETNNGMEYSSMNPDNMNAEALTLFNTLSADVQRQACYLTESHSENEAVYLAALRSMPQDRRREFLFTLSKQRWGL